MLDCEKEGGRNHHHKGRAPPDALPGNVVPTKCVATMRRLRFMGFVEHIPNEFARALTRASRLAPGEEIADSSFDRLRQSIRRRLFAGRDTEDHLFQVREHTTPSGYRR